MRERERFSLMGWNDDRGGKVEPVDGSFHYVIMYKDVGVIIGKLCL